MPDAERRAWLWVAGWTLGIYTAIPLARSIQGWVQAHADRQLFSHLTYAALALALLAILWQARRGRLRLSPAGWAIVAGLAACYAGGTYLLRANPEEAIHLVQYGVLSALLLWAFRYRLKGPGAHLAAFLTGTLLGIGDEFIQWLTPERVFDVRDIVINTLAVAGLQLGGACLPGATPAADRRPITSGAAPCVARASLEESP